MTGVYLIHWKSIKICWCLLIASLALTGLLVIVYVIDQDEGANYEANQRCDVWMTDPDFSNNYTFDSCKIKMKTQILWTVIGLYVIYCIASGFGIHIIKSAQQHLVVINEKYN